MTIPVKMKPAVYLKVNPLKIAPALQDVYKHLLSANKRLAKKDDPKLKLIKEDVFYALMYLKGSTPRKKISRELLLQESYWEPDLFIGE